MFIGLDKILFFTDSGMPAFRWPDIYHDISLAKEVIPKSPKKAEDWESIATCLNLAFSTEDKPVYLKGRGCRERMNRLVEKYKWKKLKLWNDML